LDGTLYPNYRLNCRLLPFLLKEWRFMAAFGRTRNIFHDDPARGGELTGKTERPAAQTGFYADQAAVLAGMLGEQPDYIQHKLETLIYRGWEPYFKKVKLYGHAVQALDAIKAAGIKMGLLSDFPPETKIKYLGIESYWDTVLCSEVIGTLKPHPLPFIKLAEELDTDPREILYVGNSYKYDGTGAQRAGMRAAIIDRSPLLLFPGKNRSHVDFVFHDYRQLIDYVLS
jgi:putative hydrolase of the HAD superfamily